MSEIVIHDEHSNTDYRLTYTRDSIRKIEAMGFNIGELTDKPMTMIPLLIRGAFLSNHPSVSNKVIDELYDDLDDKESFISVLVELYQEPLTSLVGNTKKGKVKWEKIG